MTNKPVISIVSDESVTVFYGGRPFVLEAEHPRFKDLVEAVGAQDHDRVDAIVNASDRLSKVLGQYGDVAVYAGQVTFQGRPILNSVVERIPGPGGQGPRSAALRSVPGPGDA